MRHMANPRFFCGCALDVTDLLDLPETVSHHVRVRRLRVDDVIVLFDGAGTEAQARILQTGKSGCSVQIMSVAQASRELNGHITLVQGMASQDKMDWIIEKATELGAARLIPVQARRSVTRLSDDRARRRTAHGARIVESASEQCGRNHLMHLAMPSTLEEAIDQCEGLTLLACMPGDGAAPIGDRQVLDHIEATHGCAIFIGPEGGWDKTESDLLTHRGAIAISLGQRVLRTETAGMTAIAALVALLGWDRPPVRPEP